MLKTLFVAVAMFLPITLPAFAADVLIEAESFAKHGGWKLDTQFIDIMGSPYLLAHGLGRPVDDATTTVELPAAGKYRVFVRTKDWVAQWKATGQPGKFQVLVDGKPLEETFGTKSADWFWHDGGVVDIEEKTVRLALHDLTGFEGRCDAVLFTTDLDSAPPNEFDVLSGWRRRLLGLDDEPTEKGGYDLVVVGGGYSGMGAAISAARLGCKVALIQNRPVLGGNGSSEVRVWANGLTRRGRFPRIGEIIEEFADNAKKSPGLSEEFGDDRKAAVVRAEKNLDLFLNHHAYQLEMDGDRIAAVFAFDTRTSERKRFIGRHYCDGTGHGVIGYLAGAHYDMTPKGRMGMSNMWRWDEADKPAPFPETPWALDLEMEDFPFPRDHHGQWFWESGFDKDPINDAETIRDWNLRAVYGAFNAMKNRGGADQHKNAMLSWIAFIGGPRESRRLLGDVILTGEDITAKRDFPDGCVPSTWSIDLHYPKQQYAEKYPDNPFISYAKFDRGVDRIYGYPVPYRCFYSRNVSNLFMAGRCVSVSHEALGTVRVMKTCGMMGEVVGKAAAVCAAHDCSPRDVHGEHFDELKELMKLPGKARRATVKGKIVIPDDVPPEAPPHGPPTGLDPEQLPGLVIDDRQAKKQGKWTEGQGLKGYVGYNYLYGSPDSGATVRFEFKPPTTGLYEVRLAYLAHENRATNVPVTVHSADGEQTIRVNMREAAPLPKGFISLGEFDFKADQTAAVVIATDDAGGTVHADAIQVLPIK
ncbi:MAG: FAD-dependent oxidoreductase [Planctomycetes bacterium]|nr:FAD-dependent oxidoreductase [Planctomycetota bacterium]MBL7040853.1 FAD-dependent oxidoreductase [Pirellulaceae bacterium]